MEENITKENCGKAKSLEICTNKKEDNTIEGCKSSDRVLSNESVSGIKNNAMNNKGLVGKRRCNVQKEKNLHPPENTAPTIFESEESLRKPTRASPGIEIDCKSLDTVKSCVPDSKTFLDFGFKHIKEELKALIKQCVDKEDTITTLEKRLKDSNLNHREMRKKCLHLEKANEKLKKQLDDTTKSCDKVQQDLTAAKSQISDFKKDKKELSMISESMEMRLAQITPQNKKMESELNSLKQKSKDTQQAEREQIEEVMLENRLLKRQKDELREVVIKQMQLNANFRRRILHLEAGLVHKFTEKEVMNAVEKAF